MPTPATGPSFVAGECDGLVHKLKAIPDLDITLAQASSKILDDFGGFHCTEINEIEEILQLREFQGSGQMK